MAATICGGVHELVAPPETLARFPRAYWGREFISKATTPRDLRADFARIAAPWEAAGLGVYISFKPALEDVAAGRWTTFFRLLGAWLADHPTVKVIIWHEPEDDFPGRGADFAAMFNRGRKEIKAGYAGAVVVYCANSYRWRTNNGDAYLKPDGWTSIAADEYLNDVYSGGGSFPATAILPEHTGWNGWYQRIVAPRLAAGEAVVYGCGERGIQNADAAARAATWLREGDWLATRRGAFDGADQTKRPPTVYLAWGTVGAEDDPGWPISGESVAAVNALLEDLGAPLAGPVHDRYQEGYDAGRASMLVELSTARAEGERAGRARGAYDAYVDAAGFAMAKASALGIGSGS